MHIDHAVHSWNTQVTITREATETTIPQLKRNMKAWTKLCQSYKLTKSKKQVQKK